MEGENDTMDDPPQQDSTSESSRSKEEIRPILREMTKVEIIEQDQYYTSYYDVFGETCDNEKDKKRMFNDYGQCWDRQSFRKDFNPALTKSKVLHYNDKAIN